MGVWAFFSPSVADRPLRPAKDHRLGSLLHYQLPNLVGAVLSPAIHLFIRSLQYLLHSLISHAKFSFSYITHPYAT